MTAVPDPSDDPATDQSETADKPSRPTTPTAAGFASAVEGDQVVFRHHDPEHLAATVSLWSDLQLGETTFEKVDGGWQWRLVDPPVDRIEYLFDVDGAMTPDPSNPRLVDGAFGPHSWLPLPGYREPTWLGLEPIASQRVPATIETRVGPVEAQVWSPADAESDEPLPMLIAHDGPEMDRFGELTRYVGASIGAGRLPRLRVTLLTPGARNERYAANPEYAAALTDEVVPDLLTHCPSEHLPVLTGASLGALAALHAAWHAPDSFAGLLLQSGSFFTPTLDAQEKWFEFFGAITGFVQLMQEADDPGLPPIAMTCGTAEENLANNQAMRERLTALSVPLTWNDLRDGHTWTCWRDTLDPALTALLTEVFT